MKSRRYVLSLLAVGFGLFLAVVATNLLIDPQHVFGTNLLPPPPNANDRYERVVAYQTEPARYDGLIFGSSRAFALPLDDLSARMGDVQLAKFDVVGGMLVDHLAALKWALRIRRAGAPHMRAAFLLLDIDTLGQRPFTNQSNQYLMPPTLSGENPARFWWKNLVSIQFKAWRSALTGRRIAAATTNSRQTGLVAVPSRLLSLTAPIAAAQTAQSNTAPDNAVAAGYAADHEAITRRPDYRQQLGLLRQFVELCNGQGISLTVALSPLSSEVAARYRPEDLQSAIDEVSEIVPVWDFTGFAGLSDRHLWHDPTHFNETVAVVMIRRIFGADVPQMWSGFGRRLPS